MGEVCAAQKKSWLCVIWQTCNVFMSVFFSLATYVQVGYGVPAVLCALIGLNLHVTETLPWRRVADLYVMISSAVVAMLGWKLYKERITEIFQQEEGRYATVGLFALKIII
ncbi:Transmembrane protein 220 [Collichthys lucidus]|uniref:Transmembrane protein 220 n=1 Tax=Collichthys lucidus TaxID=240159 RepID=A0A4U5VSY3_COLLU|nr:Transmembrane protein 220 [Collichthys lucidus]